MSIRDDPHYEVSATELAAWVEQQGTDTWWNVDGDPILTGRLSFPCPGDELADELRRINRPLLVQDKRKSPGAAGQQVDRKALDTLADSLGNNLRISTGDQPDWTNDRFFYLCWKGSDEEWLLVEDRETTESSRKDLAARGKP